MIDLLSAQPLTKRILAEKAGTTQREVEAFIQDARLKGSPILSDSDGYRLCYDPSELRRCAERLRSRAMTQLSTAAALNDTADRLEAPLVLWDVAA